MIAALVVRESDLRRHEKSHVLRLVRLEELVGFGEELLEGERSASSLTANSRATHLNDDLRMVHLSLMRHSR